LGDKKMRLELNTTSLHRPTRQIDEKQDARLREACKDFEALFLTMMWKEAQKSSSLNLGGYDALVEQVIGDVWSKGGGLGLAKVIYESVSNHPFV
jgi:Rod binding domain-containing protein